MCACVDLIHPLLCTCFITSYSTYASNSTYVPYDLIVIMNSMPALNELVSRMPTLPVEWQSMNQVQYIPTMYR